jgi:uncharacterized membrane protein YsdA (DUF1294 family)
MPPAPIEYLLLTTLIFMSVITFGAYGWDKNRAQANGRRIPEATLHLLALLGGWPGALMGRRVFRHKTQKIGFTLTTFAIVILHVGLIGVWAWLQQ